jgi:hypothetical protein
MSANDPKRTVVASSGLNPVSPKGVTCTPDLTCLETERIASGPFGTAVFEFAQARGQITALSLC